MTSENTVSAAGGEGNHDKLLAAVGVDIEPGLLTLALTHRSYAYENGGLPRTSASSSSGIPFSASR